MPAKIECPVCHHPFMVLKVSKAKGEYYRCPECKHQMDKSSTEEKTVA
jgi:ssDNA-binding Zn-finger/Zn-ribbon topoisomerase 1